MWKARIRIFWWTVAFWRESRGGGYPHLSADEARQLKCVFLTHSHADHTGALPWLRQLGYTGPVVASGHTLEQLPFHLEAGQMEMLRYPVHLNRAQMETLAGENSFSRVIAYHSPEIPSEEVYRV